MLCNAVADIDAVYVFKITYDLLSESSLRTFTSISQRSSCSFHTSLLIPLPKAGGSNIIASYFFSLLISLSTNFIQSSTMKRTLSSRTFDRWLFSLHQLTAPFDAST